MLADRILVSGSPEQTDGWDVQLLYFTCPSLSSDDRRLYLISAKGGHPNVYVRDLETGEETRLTDNRAGDAIYFNSRDGRYVKVYKVNVSGPGRS